jgi:hypothetical protein
VSRRIPTATSVESHRSVEALFPSSDVQQGARSGHGVPEREKIKDWSGWLTDFRKRFIQKNGWNGKEAHKFLRDGWARLQGGKIVVVESSAEPPEGALPVFEFLSPLGWKLPLPLSLYVNDQLRKSAPGAKTDAKSLRERVLAMLEAADETLLGEIPKGAEGDIQIKRVGKAQTARVLRNICASEELIPVIDGDCLWEAILWAIQFGRRNLLFELYSNAELLASAIKAQSFSSGKGGDALSQRLESCWLLLRKKNGRNPKPARVAEAAGGEFDSELGNWEFLEGELSQAALHERLRRIKSKVNDSGAGTNK